MPQVLALVARWNALPKWTRALAAAAGAAVAVLSIAVAVFSRAPVTPLFATPLHAEQLAEVEERLASWNVAFAPSADNVLVDAGRRNDLRLRLALAGVPHAHIETTSQALANAGALTPQVVLDAQARAGLAGDIEEALRGIDGVDDARAIVVPAASPEFAGEAARGASASVRLHLRPGARLSGPAVAGIRAFVASSVAGLDPSHVTLLDDDGVALGSSDARDAADGLQSSLQSALDGALGEGNAIVRVRAEYRDAAVAEREERRTPLAGNAIERTASEESYDGDGKRYHSAAERDDRGSETHETLSQTPQGALARISTAVFVDRTRAADLAAVRELAAATVGYDPKRGDVLSVAAVDFAREAAPRRDGWWLAYGAIVPLLPAVAIAAGLVGVARVALPPLLALARSAFDRFAVQRTSKAVAGFAPQRVRSALDREPPHAAAAIISALPAATAAAVLDLYPAHEREAIVRRMQRPQSPLCPDVEEVLRRHA